MSTVKLSIIIPVCNVEKYIRACLESIFRQGLSEDAFEVILVDDGSTDGSLEVVGELQQRHANISVVSQSHAGPSVSRNTGMTKARGAYVLFVDSDDLLMDNGLKVLLHQALEKSADMVVADFMRVNDEDMLPGYEASMTDDGIVDKPGLAYYVENYDPNEGSFIWRILYRRAFLEENDVRFEPGVYYEDIPFLQKCYMRAGRVIGVHLLYYIYRIRPRSCTYSFGMKNALDYNTAIANSWQLMKTESLTGKARRKLQDNIFLFFNYAVDCIIGVFRQPSERKAIVSDLQAKVPDLAFGNGLRQKTVSCMYRISPYGYISWRLFRTKVRNWLKARLG